MSSALTASTTVCWGDSLSITATSPNWRSASTSTTGRSDRLASTTARLVATTDLPAPPLVENTVMTRPRSPSPSTSAGSAGRRARHDEPGGHPGHGLGQLGGLDRGLEDVLDPGAERSLEHLGGELVGDHDGADVTSGRQELLDGRQLRALAERRAQHDHDRDRTESGGQVVDRREGGGPLPELHGQATAGGLVGIDHCDRDLATTAPGRGPRSGVGHVLARLTGERTRHDAGFPAGP